MLASNRVAAPAIALHAASAITAESPLFSAPGQPIALAAADHVAPPEPSPLYCVSIDRSSWRENDRDVPDLITVTNDCPDSRRVSTAYSTSFETECRVLAPGQSYQEYLPVREFAGIATC